MPTVRKVTSKIVLNNKKTTLPSSVVEAPTSAVVQSTENESSDERATQVRSKRVCQFCTNKTEPVYWEITGLRRFINDRGRISLRARTGNCAKHQRRVAVEIKHARHLAMLPFTVQV